MRALFPRLLLLAGSIGLASPALAHDTWFRVSGSAAARTLELGTGARYPQQETAIGAEYLERQGCRTARGPGSERPMEPLGHDGRALQLRPPPGAAQCWAQLVPLDIELTAEQVVLYLREIRAGADTQAAWAAQQRQGVPWRERYTKHARVELAAAAPVAAPMEMDIVPLPGGRLQVLRDGLPLPGLAVELLGEAVPMGLWRHSDAQGLVQTGALPPGRWLARATDLRPPAGAPDAPGPWESRFVTLAFEISPAPR